MLRLTIFVAIIGQAILMTCAGKIPISHFKTLLYREPPVPEPKSIQSPVEEYVEQNVDNFDPNNDATYQMVMCRLRKLFTFDL